MIRSFIYDTLILRLTSRWYAEVLRRVSEGATMLDVGIGTAGCIGSIENSSRLSTKMDRYEYQCWDGGPHVVLPTAVAQAWRGHEATSDDLLDPASDYGRACQIEESYGFIDVGSARALVLSDPPLVAWDPRSAAEPLFFVLVGWDTDDTDGLLDRAKAKTELRHTGVTWLIPEDGVRVIYAGDDPEGTVGGRIDVPMAAGRYALFKGEYRDADDGHVVVLKFVQEHALLGERQYR